MTDKAQKINELFREVRMRFIAWLNGRPTGEFSLRIKAKDGGIRGKPKVGVEDEV